MLPPIAKPSVTRTGLLLWLLLGGLQLAVGAEVQKVQTDQQLARASMDALFRLQYVQAEQNIARLASQNPGSPQLSFLRAGVLWLKAEAEQGDIDHTPAWQRAVTAYEVAIKEAEEQLERDPDSAEWRLALGLSQFFAARAYVGLKKITKIYHYARAGRDTLRHLIQTHPESYDAYMALGVYEYIAGSIPRSVNWLAYLFDISGDREQGIAYLRLAVEKAPLLSAEAARMLIAAAALQPEYVHEACQYIYLSRQTLQRYPENAHFSGAYQVLHANCGYASLALKENAHAREVYIKDYPDMERILNIVEVQTQRSLGNLARIKEMKSLFKKKNTAYWHLALGQYYDIQGQRELARKQYRIIVDSQYPDEGQPDVLSNSENKDWLLDQAELYLRTPYHKIAPYPFDPAHSLRLYP